VKKSTNSKKLTKQQVLSKNLDKTMSFQRKIIQNNDLFDNGGVREFKNS